jgi:hypothetical protein
MKKRTSLLTVVFAVAGMIGMALPAAAANLHFDHVGTYCPGVTCVWHFVNNQTGGDDDERIWVNGSLVTSGLETKVLKNVVHYWVTTSGPLTLESAYTENAGKLVLSDLKYCCGCGCTPS